MKDIIFCTIKKLKGPLNSEAKTMFHKLQYTKRNHFKLTNIIGFS